MEFRTKSDAFFSSSSKTFKDLFEYLQVYKDFQQNLEAMFTIMGNPGDRNVQIIMKNSEEYKKVTMTCKWHGKELMESLFRLFSVLGLFDEFKDKGGIGKYPWSRTVHFDVRGHRARW